jgi:hypothetical protein
MLEIHHIQELCRQWVKVPTLTPGQRDIVQAFLDVSKKGNMVEFLIFKDSIFNQYPHDVTHAIIKARAEGLGAKEY